MKPELRTDEVEEVFIEEKKSSFSFTRKRFSPFVRFFRNVQTQAIKKNLKSGFAEVASNLGVQPGTLKGPAFEKVQPSKNSSPKGVSK